MNDSDSNFTFETYDSYFCRTHEKSLFEWINKFGNSFVMGGWEFFSLSRNFDFVSNVNDHRLFSNNLRKKNYCTFVTPEAVTRGVL